MEDESGKSEFIQSFIKTFCRCGVDGASFSELAAEAGIEEKEIQDLFGGKEDLLVQCFEYQLGYLKAEIRKLAQECGSRPEGFFISVFTLTQSMLQENRFILQVLIHPIYGKAVQASREKLLNSIKEQTFLFLQRYPISAENGLAVALLFNSALNNYVLTQDEDSFRRQAAFLLRIFQ